mgnify:CR=1 FL=1
MTIASDTLTVTRYNVRTAASDGGASAKTVASTFSIRASVQRPRAKTLQKLMEGNRTQDAWYVDTYTAINTADELTATPADTMVIDGKTYEVFEVAHVRAVIIHYEALVLRIEEGLQP